MAYLSSFVVDGGDVGGAADGRGEGGAGLLEAFARDVKRWKDGEDFEMERHSDSADSAVDSNGNDLPSAATASSAAASSSSRGVLEEMAAQREEIKRRENEARERQQKEQEMWKRKKLEEEERKRRAMEEKQRMQPDSKWGVATTNGSRKQQSNDYDQKHGKFGKKEQKLRTYASKNQAVQNSASSSRSKKQQPLVHQPPKPQKGKPKKVCGCYGNKHEPLANCLHCGRISCEYEGYDYCPFCENLISPGDADANDSAQAHKNRLLEFDRTTAERTRIHDDQEDYFVTSTSMWSTVEEQEGAKELEEERNRKLHTRGNQVLQLDL